MSQLYPRFFFIRYLSLAILIQSCHTTTLQEFTEFKDRTNLFEESMKEIKFLKTNGVTDSILNEHIGIFDLNGNAINSLNSDNLQVLAEGKQIFSGVAKNTNSSTLNANLFSLLDDDSEYHLINAKKVVTLYISNKKIEENRKLICAENKEGIIITAVSVISFNIIDFIRSQTSGRLFAGIEISGSRYISISEQKTFDKIAYKGMLIKEFCLISKILENKEISHLENSANSKSNSSYINETFIHKIKKLSFEDRWELIINELTKSLPTIFEIVLESQM